MSELGEGVLMMYRMVVVTLIAVIIFGAASVFYNYEIDVRDAEARILNRAVVDCLAPEGVLDLDEISEKDYSRILSYCDISGVERFYVGVGVFDDEDKVASLYQGDSGAVWIQDLYMTGRAIVDTDVVGRYAPGYFLASYPVIVLKDGDEFDGKIEMEVLVNHEE